MKQLLLTDKDRSALQKNMLFQGLGEDEINQALDHFQGYTQRYQKGDFLHRAGNVMTKFGLVLQGGVQVYRDDINGNCQIFANVSPGETFGESMCLLKVEEQPVSVTAIQDCKILWMKTDWMSATCAGCTPFRHRLMHRFLSMLAERTLVMNDRIQILSKSSLRAKLITFFSQYAHKYNGSKFAVPFDRADMAAYLGVDRSALSRELSKMKAEGLIDFEKNKFILLHKIED